MGRRTINAHKLLFNKLRDPEMLLSPADIDNESLIDVVERWATRLTEKDAIEVYVESHITIKNVHRFNNNILIIDVMSGRSGEPGIVHDLEGKAEDIQIGEKQAPMSSCRAVLFSPSNGQMAMWFSEYSARSSGARNLLTLLEREWPKLETGAKLKATRVIMSEAVLESGKITEIEVRLSRRSPDRADGAQTVTGTYSHVFKPGKKAPLSAQLLSVFRTNPTKAYENVGLSEKDSDDREVFVSIDVDGHKRKIQVTNPDDGLYFHEELNGPGEPILTNDELIEFCSQEAISYFERSGYYWDDSWSKAEDQ